MKQEEGRERLQKYTNNKMIYRLEGGTGRGRTNSHTLQRCIQKYFPKFFQLLCYIFLTPFSVLFACVPSKGLSLYLSSIELQLSALSFIYLLFIIINYISFIFMCKRYTFYHTHTQQYTPLHTPHKHTHTLLLLYNWLLLLQLLPPSTIFTI